jgi:predicted GNAT family N-acyltransferase
MMHFTRAHSREELQQILKLQRANLPSEVPSEIQKNEGFVTVEHTLALLKRMNDVCAHFIVKADDKVVGYALCMHPKFSDEIKVLRPMFSEIKKHYTNNDFIVMGQICIHRDFRRKGLFRKLYMEMLEGIQPEFSTIITEVDSENSRSLNAHYSIGFQPVSTYHSDDHDWVLMKLEHTEIS